MKNEYGRSMIEMLGVLAIIGVLSIGGLAGYTMAMNRHRANQILDYVARCAVIAQTDGDGTNLATDTACKTLTGDTAVPAGIDGDAATGGTVDKPVISLTVTDAKIATALTDRSTSANCIVASDKGVKFFINNGNANCTYGS